MQRKHNKIIKIVLITDAIAFIVTIALAFYFNQIWVVNSPFLIPIYLEFLSPFVVLAILTGIENRKDL